MHSKLFLVALSLSTAALASACDSGGRGESANSNAGADSSGASTFGPDLDGNGVADRLDTYVTSLPLPPEGKDAAIRYYRNTTKLAWRAMNGGELSQEEKNSVFDSASCFLLSTGGDPGKAPSLDVELMSDRTAYNAMNILMGKLSGTATESLMDREAMCGKAIQ